MAFRGKNSFCLGTSECFQVQKQVLLRNLRVLLRAKQKLIWNLRVLLGAKQKLIRNLRVLLGAKHRLIIKSNHMQLNKQILPDKLKHL